MSNQKTRRKIIFFLATVTLVTLGFFVVSEKINLNDSENESEQIFLDAAKFFDEELFFKGEGERVSFEINGKVQGAVVPHHMLASSAISGLFDSLNHDYNTAVIIGPNHEQIGDSLAYTSSSTWKTYFGDINGCKELVKDVTSSGLIVISDEIVSTEASVGVPINFIRAYLPDSCVVPIIVKETSSLEEIEDLKDDVEKVLGDNVLVLASVDFSHYLNIQNTKEMDKETLTAIEKSDYETINSFDSSHLDSSTSIILTDMLMKDAGYGSFKVLANTNSFEITGYDKNVTSYVIGVYLD